MAVADGAMSEQCCQPAPVSLPELGQVLVIGSGPVGARFVQELLQRQPGAQITVFSNEPYQPYNRLLLSSLLAGEQTPQSLVLPLPEPARHPNFRYRTATIVGIDPVAHTVQDSLGRYYPYRRLVIATGARAHVPAIPAVDSRGVYTLRNMRDAESLYARLPRARHLVVVGGGVLGIEAARGLARLHTRVTLIQQGSHLMNRQLDEAAAERLQTQLNACGIDVITNSGVREILVNSVHQVTGLKTRDGQQLECDTVLLCAGIRPNLSLARDAGLQVSSGIVVNDQLQTSDADVFAIGECCEHRGKTYGLVSPGFEQAAVLADVLNGGTACYLGSTTVSRLKVVSQEVVSLGEVNELPDRPRQASVTFQQGDACYRKLVLHKGRLVGAVGFGPWQEFRRVQEAFQSGRRVWPWQLLKFHCHGRLWWQGEQQVQQWPAAAIVCQCNRISVGELQQLRTDGCQSVADFTRACGAGGVCGSCKPLLAQLAGTMLEKIPAALPLLLLCLLTLLAALTVLWMPAASVADSVQQVSWFERFWNNKGWKQVTGFSLLGLVVLGLLMSLRKRLQWQWLGAFYGWRLWHVTLGLACAGLLVLHTGFHLGDNLNRWLVISFLSTLLLGAVAGVMHAQAHRLSGARATQLVRQWRWLHVLVAWPLPALLLAHVVSVYYF